MARPVQDPITRLARKSRLDPATGCILWNGALTYGGYPITEVGGKTMTVARFVWTLTHTAAIPPNTRVSLKCSNRLCINPDHLFLTRKKVND